MHQLLNLGGQGDGKVSVVMIHILEESSYFMNARKNPRDLIESAADCAVNQLARNTHVLKQLDFYASLLSFTAILTNFSGHNRNVVLGNTLPVQKLIGRDGSSDRIDVKEAVQVTLPIDGIPIKNRRYMNELTKRFTQK